jgi:hypothetical protein
MTDESNHHVFVDPKNPHLGLQHEGEPRRNHRIDSAPDDSVIGDDGVTIKEELAIIGGSLVGGSLIIAASLLAEEANHHYVQDGIEMVAGVMKSTAELFTGGDDPVIQNMPVHAADAEILRALEEHDKARAQGAGQGR